MYSKRPSGGALTAQTVKSLVATPVQRKSYTALGGVPGLLLQRGPAGTASFVLRFRRFGKLYEYGLGPARERSLADVRRDAAEARLLVLSGRNPVDERRATRQQAKKEFDRRVTVAEAMTALVHVNRAKWSEKYATTFTRSVEKHAKALLHRDCAGIRAADVRAVLEPIWETRAATARLVRERLYSVFDEAMRRGACAVNPATLEALNDMPGAALVSRVENEENRASVPYAEMPAVMARLRVSTDNDAALLTLAAATGTRLEETALACWGEFDLEKRVWLIPAEHRKATRGKRTAHSVPLSDQVVALLESLPGPKDTNGVVFRSARGKKPNGPTVRAAFKRVVADTSEPDATVHGLRSAVRTFIAEKLPHVRHEVGEAVLGHKIYEETAGRYIRSSHHTERVAIMQAWADWLWSQS